MRFPSTSSSSPASSLSSFSSSSNYLTPAEAANQRRPAVSPLPASTIPAPSNGPPIGNNEVNPINENGNAENSSFFQSLSQGFENLPKVVWNVHPHVKLKLRKRFYPLGVTRLTIGADYDLKNHETSLRWSWKDRIIGARLHVTGEELAVTKSFDIDIQTRLDFRASLDFRTRRTLLSMRVCPFGKVVADTAHPGLTIRQEVPLDSRLAVQFAARIRLPEARFAAGSAAVVSLGEGDFIVDLDELNFRFLLQ